MNHQTTDNSAENEKNLRNTSQRRLVLSTVRASHDHPTADTVYERARLTDPHISRGTVYRNLNLLSELGDIRRLSMPIGSDHYDLRTDNHYHFCCRLCGNVSDAPLPYMNSINKTGIDGYRIEWHRLILIGLCPECLKKTEDDCKPLI